MLIALIIGFILSAKSCLFGKPKNQAVAWRLAVKNMHNNGQNDDE
jgi:hypothetical protein